jgi:hypothetical protein
LQNLAYLAKHFQIYYAKKTVLNACFNNNGMAKSLPTHFKVKNFTPYHTPQKLKPSILV